MDSFMIFDCDNYLVYSKHNKQFFNKIASLVFQHNMTDATSEKKVRKKLSCDHQEYQNVIVLLFGPLVASLRVVKECPAIDIFQEKNTRILHVHYLEYVFIYVTDINNFQTISQMKRNLHMFVAICKFLFGISFQEVKYDSHQAQLLTSVYDNWVSSKTFPMFMLDTIERLAIGPTIQSTFVDLLSSELNRIRYKMSNLSEEMVSHAFLFVDLKLLSYCSNRNAYRISRSDWILITLLMNTLCSKVNSENQNFTSSEDYDGDDDDSDILDFIQVHLDNVMEEKHVEINEKPKFQVEQKLIFLRSVANSRYLVPFYARFLTLYENIRLIFLSQLPTTFLSYHINTLLEILHSLQYRPKELRCSHTLAEFDNSIQKLKKFYSNKENCTIDLLKTLRVKFEEIDRSKIRRYIISLDGEEIPKRLDALCSSLCSTLREVYRIKVYRFQMSCIRKMWNNNLVLDLIQSVKNSFLILKDYFEYIIVKSQRNVIVDAYCDIIPGLVSFIYIDRAFNYMVMATEDHQDNAIGDTNILNLNLSLNVLPQMIETAYNNLSKGRLSSCWSDNGLLFSYLIWFEDNSGNVLLKKKNSFSLDCYPSLICNDFIEKILISCFPCHRKELGSYRISIFCYELFYIQKLDVYTNSDTLNSDTLSQARRLASRFCNNVAYAFHPNFKSHLSD